MAGGLLGLVGLGALLWLLPGSPVTLWRADAALGVGQAGQAVALYGDVASSGWWTDLRTKALRRSAALHSTELARPDLAIDDLEQLLALTRDDELRAALRERTAELHLELRDLDAATRSYVAAVAASPAHPRAAERLVLAARSATEAGQDELAADLWTRVGAEYPSHRATARLAQARMALRDGDPQAAHRLFDQARSAADRPEIEAAARLGIATCLERLGSLDEAIAEIDSVDLPGDVRDTRLDALRQRRDVQGR